MNVVIPLFCDTNKWSVHLWKIRFPHSKFKYFLHIMACRVKAPFSSWLPSICRKFIKWNGLSWLTDMWRIFSILQEDNGKNLFLYVARNFYRRFKFQRGPHNARNRLNFWEVTVGFLRFSLWPLSLRRVPKLNEREITDMFCCYWVMVVGLWSAYMSLLYKELGLDG
jgi:hypothetical protein